MSATILVLEDDTVLRNLLSEVLQDEGYTVVAAETVPELLAMAPQRADLFITDLMLELEAVGLEAIRRVREATGKNVPALICTGAKQEVEALEPEIARLGALLLEKPFTIDELVQQVDHALNGEAKQSWFSLPLVPACP